MKGLQELGLHGPGEELYSHEWLHMFFFSWEQNKAKLFLKNHRSVLFGIQTLRPLFAASTMQTLSPTTWSFRDAFPSPGSHVFLLKNKG